MTHLKFMVPWVWEAEARIRFGIDVALLTVTVLSRSEAQLFHRLRFGISREALSAHALDIGVSRDRLDELLEILSPVLTTFSSSTLREKPGVVIHDAFETRSVVARAFLHADFPACHAGDKAPVAREIVAVTIERFGYDTSRWAFLHSHDVPVLPIRFTDRTAAIGPFMAGEELCPNCLNLHDRDAHAAWWRWPDQLVGKPLAVETRDITELLGSLTARFLSEQLRRKSPGEQMRVSFSLEGSLQALDRTIIKQHGDCANHSAGVESFAA